MAWMDTLASILAWALAPCVLPLFFHGIAFHFQAFYKYSHCHMSDWAIPRLMFWFVWLGVYIMVGMVGWIMYYNFLGFDIASLNYIPLWMVALYSILIAPWPAVVFVLNSAVIGSLYMAIMAIYVVGLSVAIILINFDLTCIILLCFVFLWHVYVAILFLLTARSKKFKNFPNWKVVAAQIMATLRSDCNEEKANFVAAGDFSYKPIGTSIAKQLNNGAYKNGAGHKNV